MSLLHSFIAGQIHLSTRFGYWFPEKFLVDGSRDFVQQFAPKYYLKLAPYAVVHDIGGGKRPLIPLLVKKSKNLIINGLDIDKNELLQAPSSYYDAAVEIDITRYAGHCDADLVICQATLEHVLDAEKAMRGIASCLKSNGIVILFLPSRRAIFALANRYLPQKLKQKILYTIFPHTKHTQGFQAYYDRATVAEYTKMADDLGLQLIEKRAYYHSSYFTFFFPLYFVWRIYMLIAEKIGGEAAAETFCLAFQKRYAPINH